MNFMVNETHATAIEFRGMLLVSGFFESVLEQHFSDSGSIFDPALKETLWKPGHEIAGISETKIRIAQGIVPKKELSGFRPAILISRGAWNRERVAIGDALNSRSRVAQWQGTHNFNCLTKSYASVEILAWETATFFETYATEFAQAVCLQQLKVANISEPRLQQEDNETYSCVVQVTYDMFNKMEQIDSGLPVRHVRPVITANGLPTIEPKTTIRETDGNKL
jgi:hypothetical protein